MNLTLLLLISFFAITAKAEDDRTPASIPVGLRDFPSFPLPNPSAAPTVLEREFAPDRPGSTGTPQTLDKGRFQLELELYNFSYLKTKSVDPISSQGSTVSEQTTYPNPTLRYGLDSSSEVQITWVPLMNQKTTTDGAVTQNLNGQGDTTLRFKKNLLGNDGGLIGFGLMPGIKLPTNTNGLGNSSVEGSLALPLNLTFGGWGLSLMPELDVRKNAADGGMHVEYNSPVSFSHSLFARTDGFIEWVSHSSDEAGVGSTAYVGAGVAIHIAKDMLFDIGSNFGINSLTPQYNPFLGFSHRF